MSLEADFEGLKTCAILSLLSLLCVGVQNDPSAVDIATMAAASPHYH